MTEIFLRLRRQGGVDPPNQKKRTIINGRTDEMPFGRGQTDSRGPNVSCIQGLHMHCRSKTGATALDCQQHIVLYVIKRMHVFR